MIEKEIFIILKEIQSKMEIQDTRIYKIKNINIQEVKISNIFVQIGRIEQ